MMKKNTHFVGFGDLLEINIYIYAYVTIFEIEVFFPIRACVFVYIVLYIKKLYIYTIAKTTEPARKIYWINLQVKPKPIYMYI